MTDFGVVGRAIKRQQASISLINPRDFTTDNYRRIDERPFGGGPGMVMMAEPLDSHRQLPSHSQLLRRDR